MKQVALILAVAALSLGAAIGTAPVRAERPDAAQHLAVPAYFYPGAPWTQLVASAPTVGIAVMNPNSGPGTASNPDYVRTVHDAQQAGITVLGYVHTSYGARPLAEVLADVSSYYTWYGVDGVFVDEASTDCVQEATYYRPLYHAIKAQAQPGRDRVALNPGTQTHECYMGAADVVVTFEGSYSSYVSGYTAPGWVVQYDADRFWHLVYAAPTTGDLLQAVFLSKQRRAGWVYVTPDTLPNPWDTLPAAPYWRLEQLATRCCERAEPRGR